MTSAIGWLCVIYLFYFLDTIKCTLDYDFYLERCEHLNGDKEDGVDFRNFKVVRKGREYVVSGNFSLFIDLDDTYQTAITSAYSTAGNSRYIKYPLSVPRTPICVFFNTTYKKYIEPGLAGHTSFPIIPPEGLCPIPKGTYTANEIFVDKTNLPDHVPRAVWKIEFKVFKGKTCYGGFNVYIKVVDKN